MTSALWTDPSGVEHEVTASQKFRLEVTNDGAAECWLARFSPAPCDGQIRACHLVSAQRIKQYFPLGAWRWPGKPWVPIVRKGELEGFEDAVEIKTLGELVYDPRIGVPGCGGPTGAGGHHGALDTARTLKIPREALPEAVEDFCAEYGLTWHLINEYGVNP